MSLADLGTLVVEKIQSRFGLTTRGLRKALTQYDLDKNGLLDVSEIVSLLFYIRNKLFLIFLLIF